MTDPSSRLKIRLGIVAIPIAIAAVICVVVYRLVSPAPATDSPAAADTPVPAVVQKVEMSPTSENNRPTTVVDTATDAAPTPTAKANPSRRLLNSEELLAAIRKDLFTDPEKTLELSREGKARFEGSASAPDFNYYEIRSLVELKRFDEAIAETDAMLARYPGNEKAEDARRHLKSHPMGVKPHGQ